MPRIHVDRLIQQLTELFASEGVSPARSHRLAELYTQASADGVYSHGVHFVPNVLRALREKAIPDPQSVPTLVASFGALERYDGQVGLGSLNAEFCIDRAMALSDAHGIGCVALRNTRHWGRPGNYGWRAAGKGYLAICWTNTNPVMPAWGSTIKAIGNNPIVFAAPGTDGEHLVLDIAMSQFSIGRLRTQQADGEQLPVIGGVDTSGSATTDAGAILTGGHCWPMGFWKGSGLAILLDTFAAILADGQDTLSLNPSAPGVSQVYIAFQPKHLGGREASARTRDVLRRIADKNPQSRYPGQAALAHRKRSEAEGVYVRDDVAAQLNLVT
jgi:3-dehydro-L-gulonate 2-dehydrogenase